MKKHRTFELNNKQKEETFVIMPYFQSDMDNHKHDFFELVYITDGSAKHLLNNTEETMVYQQCHDVGVKT